MRTRPSARLLVVDPAGRILLFRFAHSRGAFVGEGYWATPAAVLRTGKPSNKRQSGSSKKRPAFGWRISALQ